MKSYNEVADAFNMDDEARTRFIAYMRMRWGDPEDEEIKCQCGYASEWAERFIGGIEMGCSDTYGKRLLSNIDPEYYSRE